MDPFSAGTETRFSNQRSLDQHTVVLRWSAKQKRPVPDGPGLRRSHQRCNILVWYRQHSPVLASVYRQYFRYLRSLTVRTNIPHVVGIVDYLKSGQYSPRAAVKSGANVAAPAFQINVLNEHA